VGKALGIAGFVILLVSFPVPIVGNYITFLALALAAGAALAGDRTWTLVIVIIAAMKLFFLSPTWRIALFPPTFHNPMGLLQANQDAIHDAAVRDSHPLWFLTIVGLGAPLAIMAFRSLAASSALPAADPTPAPHKSPAPAASAHPYAIEPRVSVSNPTPSGVVDAKALSPPAFCDACGRAVGEADRFCGGCGTLVTS
jgi:hypothetical protein